MTDSVRSLQLSLVEGLEKWQGPLPLSVVSGLNADLIASVRHLYLAGSVLDVTYGRGMWWTRWRPEPFASHDLALDGVDFRQLPEATSSWDAVCFDPPYVPRHGPNDCTRPHDQKFRDRYGLATSRSQAELELLIRAGLGECARVARRWVLVKCTDYVTARRFHLGHRLVLDEGERLGLRAHDLLILNSGSGPGGGQIERPLRAPEGPLVPGGVQEGEAPTSG